MLAPNSLLELIEFLPRFHRLGLDLSKLGAQLIEFSPPALVALTDIFLFPAAQRDLPLDGLDFAPQRVQTFGSLAHRLLGLGERNSLFLERKLPLGEPGRKHGDRVAQPGDPVLRP